MPTKYQWLKKGKNKIGLQGKRFLEGKVRKVDVDSEQVDLNE